jgi:hypothetical protein
MTAAHKITVAAAWRVGRLAALLALVLLVRGVAAAQEVGTLAAVEGTVELGRAGNWTTAAIGTGVAQGDDLRTGRPGRARVVFQDDSVLTMADASELRIDEQTFDSNRGVAHSLLRLVQGKVRTVVGGYTERRGSSFTIETQTAVVGVRGTEFIVVFDPVADVSDVVGVSGRAEVHSPLDRVGHAVVVTAREITTVLRGRYPTPARRLRDDEFRQYLDALEFTGAGRAESLVAGLPLVTGAGVPEGERATLLPAPIAVNQKAAAPTTAESRQQQRDASSLVQQPPAVVERSGKVGVRF